VSATSTLAGFFAEHWYLGLTGLLLLFGVLIAGAAVLLVRQWRIVDRDHGVPGDASTGAPAAAPASVAPAAAKPTGRPGKRTRRAEAAPAPASGTPVPVQRGYDWRVVVILVTVAVSLSLQEYYGERILYQKLFPYVEGDRYWTLKGFAWWSGWRVFGYVVLPAITILCMPGERLRDYYVSLRGFVRHLWIYVVLYLVVLPAVAIASQTPAFSATYPFYKLANRSPFDFWSWQALYGVQFFALEFFFRGYMLRGLGQVMGSRAIFVMIVPYCMIHFGKPFAETLGAIVAGIVLGTLAMRTKSIWGGVVIHVGVAVTMDALALGHCPPAETGLPCRGH
jgi:membrane protease YdiL (CAAX protease family)